MGFLPTPQYTICNEDYVLNKSQLDKCKGLQAVLYWGKYDANHLIPVPLTNNNMYYYFV
jgi:hypothetical protein